MKFPSQKAYANHDPISGFLRHDHLMHLLQHIIGEAPGNILVRGALGSLMVKAGNSILAFIVALVLARVLGAEGYGTYSFALAVLMLCAIPAQLGIPTLMVRETARANAREEWAVLKGVWHWGKVTAAKLSGCAVLLLIAGLIMFLSRYNNARTMTLVIGLAIIPMSVLTNVYSGCVRGLGMVVLGQIPDNIIRPLCLLMLTVIWVIIIAPNSNITAPQAISLYVIATMLALFFSIWSLKNSMPSVLLDNAEKIYFTQQWRKAIMPLAVVSGMHVINGYADVMMMGLFRSNQEVGEYRVVSQMAMVVIFGLNAINQALHPYFAKLYTENDQASLQSAVTLSARAIFLIALVPFFLFLFAGSSVLAIAFGTEYAVGAVPLVILAIGQLINSAFGSVGALLNMTGHERDTMRGMTIAMAVNVALNFFLIPIFGAIGAASATAASYVIWNAILWRFVHMRLSIESSVIGTLGQPTTK